MSHLVLVRHGQSEWNEKNLFTGWRNPDLTAQGIDEAKAAGQALKQQGLVFDLAFTSDLQRAQKTLTLLLAEQGQSDLPTTQNQALNERDYGDLAGLNKDDARKKWGDEQVHIWRRSYDTPPPGGESLKDTGARVLPYYDSAILPLIKAGKNILIAAHGNSLRSLVMRLEGLSSDEILDVNIDTGVPYIYQMDEAGAVLDKTVLAARFRLKPVALTDGCANRPKLPAGWRRFRALREPKTRRPRHICRGSTISARQYLRPVRRNAPMSRAPNKGQTPIAAPCPKR